MYVLEIEDIFEPPESVFSREQEEEQGEEQGEEQEGEQGGEQEETNDLRMMECFYKVILYGICYCKNNYLCEFITGVVILLLCVILYVTLVNIKNEIVKYNTMFINTTTTSYRLS